MPNIPFRLLRVAYHHLGRSKCKPSVMSMHRTDPDIAEFMHHNWKACLAHALAEAWPQRTAEDERRDAVAGLRQQARGCVTTDPIVALNDAAFYLERGHHEGASAR